MDLNSNQIKRYSRQLLIEEISLQGQKKLLAAKVLIVGLGGLGSPSAIYLAGAGIGTLGLLDYDTVDITNLQRQIIHSEETLDTPKTESARSFISRYNSNTGIVIHNTLLTSENAESIISGYDVVLDGSDNVSTRYLLSDTCVKLNKPLVSASALKFEGQLFIYNYRDSPCYRCIFPVPPPAAAVTNCNDGGILGPVTGVLGSLQAIETIKIVIEHPTTLKNLLVYNALDCTFKNIKMRRRSPDCIACGTKQLGKVDYPLFCGTAPTDKPKTLELITANLRITCKEYSQIEENHLLIDVRDAHHFQICSIPKSVNIPLSVLPYRLEHIPKDSKIFVVCRRGNNSQIAVKMLRENGIEARDLIGGVTAWSEIDSSFPTY